MKKDLIPILHLIGKMVDIRLEYSEIKNSAERENSTVMGKHAIKYLIIFLLSVAVGIAILLLGASMRDSLLVIFAIIIILAGAVFILYSFSFLLLALSCSIKQLKLNKKPIGWVTLTITLAILLAAIIAVVIGLTSVL